MTYRKTSHAGGAEKNREVDQVILLDKGDYPAALEQMKGYLSFAPDAQDIDLVRKQIAELERVTGGPTTAQTPKN